MLVVVMVVVAGECRGRARAEEGEIARIVAHRLGRAAAADMAVEADDAVGGGHDQMQVVADHEDAAALLLADAVDQPEEGGLALVVDAGGRLVEHEEVGTTEQGAGEQDALQLAAGERLQRPAAEPGDADAGERCLPLGGRMAVRQVEEAVDVDRQGRIDGEALRHVGEAQAGRARDPAGIGLDDAEHQLDQGRLARTVRADQADDLAAVQGEIDVLEGLVVAEPDRGAGHLDEQPAHGAVASRQAWQRPWTSRTTLSMAKSRASASSSMRPAWGWRATSTLLPQLPQMKSWASCGRAAAEQATKPLTLRTLWTRPWLTRKSRLR